MNIKLKNLMFATMIACAFSSCSNEDGPVNLGDDTEANATLEVRVGRAETKALPTTDLAEDKINNLSLLVFNGTGDGALLESIGTAQGDAGAGKAVKTESIKPGNKTVVVLANIDLSKTTPAVTVGMTYASFLTAQLSFANEKLTTGEGFTMNSKFYQVSVIASKTNYMGYNEPATANSTTKEYLQGVAAPVIKLYRNVAKIVLNKVELGSPNLNQYPDAAIALKEVFVLHGHANTTIVGAAAAQWGPINVTGAYLNGAANDLYNGVWAGYMKTKVNGKDLTKVYNFIPGLGTYNQEDSYLPRTLSGNTFTYNARNINPFYVYENTESVATDGTDYCTLLVVKADFSYTDVTGATITEKDRFYPVAVGYNAAGTANTTDFNIIGANEDFKDLRTATPAGVLRNLQYVVNLKITGPGYKTPFGPKPDGGDGGDGDTHLDAQVKVIGFADVIQHGEVE